MSELQNVDIDFGEFLNRIKEETDFDTKKIEEAYEFSKEAHKGQFRATGEPYIIHPIEVAKIVFDFGLGTPSIIASLLHDIVEDTNISLKTIRDKFGGEVELLVDGLTKINTFTENREEQNLETLRKILLASTKDIRVLIIKLCDRLHNLRTLDSFTPEKQARIAKNTMLLYAPLAQKIGIYPLKWELEDLSFKYRNPEMYQLIKKKIQMKRIDREKIVSEAVSEIKDVLTLNDMSRAIVIGRPKNFYSVYKKIKDKAKAFEDIYDLYAVRIIVNSVSECYTILGILHEKFQVFPDRLKDYITNPKQNGYQSIHTTIYSRQIKGPVEVQIRTKDMQKIAEFGIAAHWKYKNLKEDKRFEKKISWLREVLMWEKENKEQIDFLQLLKYDFFQNEIFVFTPKNELIFLPEGSSVLDFAYAVHTEIGAKAYKAKVNGAYTTIDKILKNGDIVEVLTRLNIKPTEKWLKFVQTSKAKIKIRDAIQLKHKTVIDSQKKDDISFETLKTKLFNINEYRKVRKARCCSLEYGDNVLGLLLKDGELVVHNANCINTKNTNFKQVPLNWTTEKTNEVILNMILKDKIGLLVDILNVLAEFNLTVLKLNTKILRDNTVKLDLKIIDGPHLDDVVRRFRELESVDYIKTTRPDIFT